MAENVSEYIITPNPNISLVAPRQLPAEYTTAERAEMKTLLISASNLCGNFCNRIWQRETIELDVWVDFPTIPIVHLRRPVGSITKVERVKCNGCLLYTSPSPRD